jgi:hypothetical protein
MVNFLGSSHYLDIKILHCDLNNIQKIINIHFFKGSIFLHIAGINYSKKILRFCLLNKINWLISVHTSGKFSSYKPQSKYYLDTDNSWVNPFTITCVDIHRDAIYVIRFYEIVLKTLSDNTFNYSQQKVNPKDFTIGFHFNFYDIEFLLNKSKVLELETVPIIIQNT